MSTSESQQTSSACASEPLASSPAESNGLVDLSTVCPLKNSQCERTLRAMATNHKETAKHVSPKGTLNLPPLLDARRLEHGIPDKAFAKSQAAFDRIFIWQIDEHNEETYIEGGTIVRSQAAQDAMKKSANRGILVSAGLSALDTLRSHGFDLGHIVTFMSIQPWKLPLGFIDLIDQKLLMMRDGDLCGSEDLVLALRSGAVKVQVSVDKDGKRIHRYVDQEGKIWDPVMPWISDDQ